MLINFFILIRSFGSMIPKATHPPHPPPHPTPFEVNPMELLYHLVVINVNYNTGYWSFRAGISIFLEWYRQDNATDKTVNDRVAHIQTLKSVGLIPKHWGAK